MQQNTQKNMQKKLSLLACLLLPMLSHCGGGASSGSAGQGMAPPQVVVSSPMSEPYGLQPMQTGTLRLPDGPGPFPLIVLIHGGCWQRALASADIMNALASSLTREGWATWNIEYRTLGDSAYSWPATFVDVAAAIDYSRTLARRHPLDLQKLTLIGHSAGGHLALWAASRARLPVVSELIANAPLLPEHVIGLAAITDLERYPQEGASCGSAVAALLGQATPTADRLAETSPLLRLPLSTRITLITASDDAVVPSVQASRYSERANGLGMQVQQINVAGDHLSMLAGSGPTLSAIRSALQAPAK